MPSVPVPFRFHEPPDDGPVRQGEILRNVWEHRVDHSAGELPEHGEPPQIRSVQHPLVVVMNADCDLNWDYRERVADEEEGEEPDPGTPALEKRKYVPYVLVCDAYRRDALRPHIPGSDIFRRIDRNQDERYGKIFGAQIGEDGDEELPDLYLDFKKTFAVHTPHLYEAIDEGEVDRVALLPPVYVHYQIHRFYSFHSRVGIPDQDPD